MKISTLLCFQAESTGGKSRRSGFVVKSWRRQSRQVPAFILDEEDDVLEDEKMTAGVAGAFVDTLAEEVVVEEQEEKEEIQLRISDVDKLLSRCTDTEIRSFENLYTHQRLSQATKVPFSTYSCCCWGTLITFKHHFADRRRRIWRSLSPAYRGSGRRGRRRTGSCG